MEGGGNGVDARLCIVGIGASAGGLEAIREMLAGARPGDNLTYVVIQHLDPNHESLLAELLARQTELEVRQASGGEKVTGGQVYIIPPGHGLSIEGGVLHLTDFEQPRGLRRPIDDFFESLGRDQGRNAVCVILSGTGADGSNGLRAVKEHGGLCIAQEPRTARYDGMPVSAKGTGLVDFICVPDEIIRTIRRYHAFALHNATSRTVTQTVEESVEDICSVLRTTIGHDFSGYKTSTLVRRIERRVQVLGLRDASAYLARIRSDPAECELLFRELLINVTRFFRDPEAFDVLRDEVVEPLVNEEGRDEIRVWVPGCSSGEEAFSIAMLFADAKRRSGSRVNIQIFATDIDEQMLRIARDAVYPLAALIDIPEPLRDAYTVGREGKFQINAAIRDMVRFSLHSLVRDPPFSGIDLLSCRNLLIYFADKLQDLVLPVFHFALKPGAALFVGPSETLGRYDEHFKPVNAPARLFQRDRARSHYPRHLQVGGALRRAASAAPPHNLDRPDSKAVQTAAVDRLLEGYAPATLQVSASGEVISSTGRLAKYLDLDLRGGGPVHAPSLARAGLKDALSAVLRQVVSTGRKTVSRDLEAVSEFGRQPVELVADPLPDQTVLLVFRDRDRFAPAEGDEIEEIVASDSHVASLEDELRATRARLHVTVEELETANEELKSSNEEMMSMNEELQSTNEELSTVNDELKGKIGELSVVNADLQNFFASTALPLVVVDCDLGIRNYTESILALYPFRHGDKGRPLTDVASHLRESEAVIALTREVIETQTVRQVTVTDRERARTWSLVVTPYRTREGEIDGATLVFTEITEALRLEDALSRESARLQLALGVAGLGVWEYDLASDRVDMDDVSRQLFGLPADARAIPRRVLLGRVHRDDAAALNAAFDGLADEAGGMDAVFRLATRDVSPPSLKLVGRRTDALDGGRRLGVVYDVSDAMAAMEIRELMLREMNHRVKNMFSILSGMIRIGGRDAASVAELTAELERRIAALASSHNLTQRGADEGELTLHEVLSVAVAPYRDDAGIDLAGPPVRVHSKELNALSLLLHELATNAAKYGVLGDAAGRLSVAWSVTNDGCVSLEWNEIRPGGAIPEVEGPSEGFGSTLMRLSATQLQADLTVEAGPNGRLTRLVYEPYDQYAGHPDDPDL